MISGNSLRVKHSLFQDDDGGSTPTLPLYFISEIDHKTAKVWVEKWHYSKRMPTGKNINYGLYVDGKLYAVIVYGIGVNPYQAKFLGVNKVLEIKRMCRSEPADKRHPLSRFISISMRMCVKDNPADCIVAFADPEQGHEGTVYRASGFEHRGMSNPEFHLVGQDGVIRHRRLAFRHSRRNGISIEESRNQLGLKRIKTLPKHRYVRMLTNTGAVAGYQ